MNIKTLPNTFSKETEDTTKGKVIRKASLARQILKVGGETVRIIDLKQDRLDRSGKRTVFVFEDSDKFREIFSKVMDENQKVRELSNTELMRKEIENLRNEIAEMKKVKTEE